MTASPHRRTGITRRLVGWSFNLTVLAVTVAGVAWLAPSAFGFSRYVITGGSMEPTIAKGSVVFERSVGVDELEVGDVITYQPPAGSGVESLVTHRITEMQPAGGGGVLFTTQGDANAKPDPWRFKLEDEQQPVVELSVPYAGWVFIALADRTTRMLLIGGPAALIALLALAQVLGAVRSGRRSDEETPADETLQQPEEPSVPAVADRELELV